MDGLCFEAIVIVNRFCIPKVPREMGWADRHNKRVRRFNFFSSIQETQKKTQPSPTEGAVSPPVLSAVLIGFAHAATS